MLKVLDLFSGIGGFSLGLERTGGFETVAFCEIEDFPRKVLRKHWPGVPIFEDVRKLGGGDVGPIDVITGGYPCQPFSSAGKRQGAEDDRHLWPEVARLLDECRPTWFIGENVAGHITMGLDEVLSDLEGQGYTARTFVIPACAVDAPHRRYRVWIVAHSDDVGRGGRRSSTGRQAGVFVEGGGGNGRTDVANDDSRGQVRTHADGGEPNTGADGRDDLAGCSRWLPEPPVGRVANGIPRRVDRLKGLGNAVVPQIPEIIGHAILEAEGRIT